MNSPLGKLMGLLVWTLKEFCWEIWPENEDYWVHLVITSKEFGESDQWQPLGMEFGEVEMGYNLNKVTTLTTKFQ